MDVVAAESSITNVLNLYYSWLIKMIGPKGSDKVALLSTITTFDVEKTAPLYTNYVFRGFADRTISVSPEDFGAGNTNDRYSRIYNNIVSMAASDLYAKAKLTKDQQAEIDGWDGDITEAVTEIKNIRRDVLGEWTKYAELAGLKPGTPAYDLERAKFYQPYIDLIRVQRQKIVHAQAKRRAIWFAVFKNDKLGAQLSLVFERCVAEDNRQSLPTDINIETKYGLDPITIGAAADSGMFAFETELGMLPSGTLTKILDLKGSRGAEFKTNEEETHNHDQEWHASGSGSWGIFSAKVSGQEEHHFRQSLTKLESISIDCDYMGEYWVNRRDWFSSDILSNKYIVEMLKEDPAAAALLAMCISSLIIVRGLRVTYKFKDQSDTAIWSSYNYSGGGGFNAFGIDYGKLSGGTSGSKYDHVVNTKEKSVTFFDDPDVCRLLALRVSPLISNISPEQIAFETRPLDESLMGRQLLEAWKSGDAPFGRVPETIRAKRLVQ